MRRSLTLCMMALFFCFSAFAHNENKMTMPVDECNIIYAWFIPTENYSQRIENLRAAVKSEKHKTLQLHELNEKNSKILEQLLIEDDAEKINYLLYQHLEIKNTTTLYTRSKLSQLIVVLSVIIILFVITTIWLAFVTNSSKHKAMKEKELNNHILDAQERERRRIAQELHDTITQDIRASLLYIRELKENLPDDNMLCKIENLETQNLKNLRAIIQNLTSSEIEAEDFGRLISQHCFSVTENRNIHCSFFAPQGTDFSCLSTTQKLNIFRIIQEAVNNALKHANASSINIIVRHDLHSHKMFFFISDDGQGIEASRIQQEKDNSSKEMSSHYGLEGMKYRADMLNAELQISSSSEMGTEIKLIVPIE